MEEIIILKVDSVPLIPTTLEGIPLFPENNLTTYPLFRKNKCPCSCVP